MERYFNASHISNLVVDRGISAEGEQHLIIMSVIGKRGCVVQWRPAVSVGSVKRLREAGAKVAHDVRVAQQHRHVQRRRPQRRGGVAGHGETPTVQSGLQIPQVSALHSLVDRTDLFL